MTNKKIIDWHTFKSFGRMFFNFRVHVLEKNLRDFCKELDLDSREWSCVERELKQVTKEETNKIFEYINNIYKDFSLTKVGHLLKTLSEIQIIEKRYNTEEDILQMLPVFIPVSQEGIKLSKKELESFIESMKENW